jgi:hypothetical protein
VARKLEHSRARAEHGQYDRPWFGEDCRVLDCGFLKKRIGINQPEAFNDM